MGTKFGNVHVKSDDLNEITSALREIASARVKEGTPKHDLTGFESIVQRARQLENVFYIGEWGNGWISILNDCFGWGKAESFGEVLSGMISSPVFTVSCFDDDVLEMNVYRNGEEVTGHVWCSGYVRADYGLDEKEADISVLSRLLGHEHTATLISILDTEDREKAVEEMESVMGVPLRIHSDWFGEMGDDPFIRNYVKYDFNQDSRG
ncbi:hypothetical protein [Paenibacillus sp. GYB003]|uniref:hypothetical protein n=1 Tax=Paenibacillus sp. GYB003 TaxID=2994392 RepID=UPI002F969794